MRAEEAKRLKPAAAAAAAEVVVMVVGVSLGYVGETKSLRAVFGAVREVQYILLYLYTAFIYNR